MSITRIFSSTKTKVLKSIKSDQNSWSNIFGIVRNEMNYIQTFLTN